MPDWASIKSRIRDLERELADLKTGKWGSPEEIVSVETRLDELKRLQRPADWREQARERDGS